MSKFTGANVHDAAKLDAVLPAAAGDVYGDSAFNGSRATAIIAAHGAAVGRALESPLVWVDAAWATTPGQCACPAAALLRVHRDGPSINAPFVRKRQIGGSPAIGLAPSSIIRAVTSAMAASAAAGSVPLATIATPLLSRRKYG